MPKGLLIRCDWIVTPDEGRGVRVLEGQVVALDGPQILYVGPEAGLPDDFAPTRVLDGSGRALIPGFVNAHQHAAMTLLRGYADDMRLMEWLQEKVWPAEARLTPEDVYWGTLLAIAEQLRSGITAFADMYFFMDEVARAVEEAGVRACLAAGLIGLKPDADRQLREGVELFQRWHGRAGGRITIALGPHAPYTCPDWYMKEVMGEARRLGAAVHIHLAETAEEVERLRAERGVSPVRWAHDLGLFELPVTAFHCVHVDAEDIALLASGGVAVVHNPISNFKLASGIAPVAELRSAGVTVALGTDGACSTNHLSMFEEMRLCAWAQKVRTGDARVLSAAEVFRMATVDGARALGLSRLGRVAPGYAADLVMVDLNASHLVPRHDLLSLVVYSVQAADVCLAVVAGRVVYEDGAILTFDESRVRAECQERARRLVA